jgi:CelD/BcsL family acetyltransferase involved in cellulose biosynthesis
VNWRPFTFRLAFRFGAVHIGSAAFRAIQPEVHPFQLPADPDFDSLPLNALDSGAEAIIFYSHPIQHPMKRLSRQHGALCYVPSTYRHFYVDLSGAFPEYLDKFSSKTRSSLQRKVRKLKQEGVEFQIFRSADELLRFYPLARQVSRKTYQDNLLNKGLPDTPTFQAELRTRGEQDTARAFLLLKGGAPIAYLYSPAVHGVLIYDYLGYDPKFRDSSPGTVLQYLALEFLFAEQKFAMFDFEEGEGQHKQMFATNSIECADVFLFAPSLRAKALIQAHRILNVLVRATLRIAERTRLKARLKRFVKKRSAE